MNWIGKQITDFYCNGYAGRRYDLGGSIIEAEGRGYVILRLQDGSPIMLDIDEVNKEEYLSKWTSEKEYD